MRILILLFAFLAASNAKAQGNGLETDYLNALQTFRQKGEKAKADSVENVLLKKFPKGIYARNLACNELYNIPEAQAAEKAYLRFIHDFPKDQFDNNIICDYAAYTVALRYASEGDASKALEYISKLNDRLFRLTADNTVGNTLFEKGGHRAGLHILKEGSCLADSIDMEQTNPRYVEREHIYISYANALYQQGNKTEALKQYLKVTVLHRGLTFARLSDELGHPMESFLICDQLLRDGSSTDESMEVMKSAWQHANGNLDSFEQYVESICTQRMNERLAKVRKSMICEEAPDFELKDINGNIVRLSNLHGKVVVLDFWATWCGPCKRSLPAMQKTMRKYRDDADVVFLFIHTLEQDTPESACKNAKTYLDSNGFKEFCLLMDTKDPATRTNKVVTSYHVKGIPAKFVIDRDGNIRFRLTGFGGSDDDAVSELSMIIDACKSAH